MGVKSRGLVCRVPHVGGNSLLRHPRERSYVENFPEGSLGTKPFTDPLSGIRFSEPTAIGGNYIIEFAGQTPNLPTISPGNYLKSNGYVPGPGYSASPNTGFTVTLPTLAQHISFDFLYVDDGGGSLTVQAFSTTGQLVAQHSLSPPVASFVEGHFDLSSATVDIHFFKMRSTLDGIGYDNIAFIVPEPFAGSILAALAMLAAISRGHQRNSV